MACSEVMIGEELIQFTSPDQVPDFLVPFLVGAHPPPSIDDVRNALRMGYGGVIGRAMEKEYLARTGRQWTACPGAQPTKLDLMGEYTSLTTGVSFGLLPAIQAALDVYRLSMEAGDRRTTMSDEAFRSASKLLAAFFESYREAGGSSS